MEYQVAYESDPDETSSIDEPEVQTRKPTKKQLEDAKVKAENERRLLNLAKARQARQQKLKEKRELANLEKTTVAPVSLPMAPVIVSQVLEETPAVSMKVEPKQKKKIPKIKVEQEAADDSSEEVIVIKRQKPKQRTKTIYIEDDEEPEEEPVFVKPKPKTKSAPPKMAKPKAKPKQHLPSRNQPIEYDIYDEYDDYEYDVPSVPVLTPIQKAIMQLRGY